MAFTPQQAQWLASMAGLEIAKTRADNLRAKKDVLATARDVKLSPVKDSIKNTLSNVTFKTGALSSIKVLDEDGGQMAEFDYDNLKNNRQFKEQYLRAMQQAMEQLAKVVADMREARTQKIDEKTGQPVFEGEGDARTPVMVPLYDDKEIAEEVYMPLVRERLMPEWLVPNQWSKTQEMLDASDELYKGALAKYTAELEEEEQSFLDAAKDTTTQLGGLAQKALAMVPGADAETASAVVGLVALGTTATIGAVQALTKSQIDASLDSIISDVGKIVTQSVTLATGEKDLGTLAGKTFAAAANGALIGKALLKTPPDAEKAISAFADSLDSALGAAFSGKGGSGVDSSVASAAAGQSAVLAFKLLAKSIPIKEHILNGDSDALIDDLTECAKDTLEAVQDIVTEKLKEGADDDTAEDIEKQQEALTAKIEKDIELLAKGGKRVVDAVKKRQLRGFGDAMVESLGDVLTSALSLSPAADVASVVGEAYRVSTRRGLVAFHLSFEPPEIGKALKALGSGFETAFALADGPEGGDIGKLGLAVARSFTAAGDGASGALAQAVTDEKYADATKAVSKLARGILGQALGKDLGAEPDATAEGDQGGSLLATVEQMAPEASEALKAALVKAVAGLQGDAAKARLAQKVDEIRTEQALLDIESSQEEVERVLIQADEGGKQAADTRSIEILIKEMQRDRLIMEMAVKLVSGGLSMVQHFVAPLAIGGAAVKLAANLIKAAQRATTLNTWINNQKDMHAAVSSFESSAANFVKNQGEQFAHYSIQAALELARMIGEIVSCTGIASAAGVALSKGAALAIAAEDISYKFYKRADLENAWRITKKAWANPDSRKLGLLARQLNPTLAKYTLAWGAVTKKDAMAQEAMRSCGLNALTLSQQDSNVEQVKHYLEVCFNEDNVVLKRYSAPDWMPDVIELTPKSWVSAKSRGEAEGGVKADAASGIAEAFAEQQRLSSAFEAQVSDIRAKGFVQANKAGLYTALEKAREAYEESLERLDKLLAAYQPVDTKTGRPHAEMNDVKGRFRRSIDEDTAQALATWQELSDRLQKILARQSLAALAEEGDAETGEPRAKAGAPSEQAASA